MSENPCTIQCARKDNPGASCTCGNNFPVIRGNNRTQQSPLKSTQDTKKCPMCDCGKVLKDKADFRLEMKGKLCMCPCHPTPESDWEKEFEKQFPPFSDVEILTLPNFTIEEKAERQTKLLAIQEHNRKLEIIKSFIRQTLSSSHHDPEYEAWRNSNLMEYTRKKVEKKRHDLIEEVIKIIQGMEIEEVPNVYLGEPKMIGYNRALDDLISRLKEMV